MSLLDDKLQTHQALGQLICQQMVSEMEKNGFSDADALDKPEFAIAEFSLVKDPYTMDENLAGAWFDQRQQRIGSIQFHSDGSFYAEYDVVKPHPTKPKWFVEAITAWGKADNITTEAKLLPMVE